ncbi:hypothetical protein [Anaplasma capra]|uniref:hypothetical protein n=1 Tax=Anaplasma capra TaxID=1562740 RepID=UPI0021D5BF69|nr:hypothetical protein [Anaplasma capra]MCU7611247.1 hypothetical protein [Anaplasma capra]MCU7612619.1 hypothetical protein [Anaplasma capra]
MKIRLNKRRRLLALLMACGFILWLIHSYKMREGARMLSTEEHREIVLKLYE